MLWSCCFDSLSWARTSLMTPCTRELESLDFPVEGDELAVGVRLKVVRVKKENRTDLIHRVYEIRTNTTAQENYDYF